MRRGADYQRLLREGRRRKIRGYTFYFAARDAGPPRLGLLVSRREARSAVERNRLKRRIREAFRLEQHNLAPLDILVRPPSGAAVRAGMVSDLRTLFCALQP